MLWQSNGEGSPYQNEWNDLVEAVRNDKPYNEVKRGVEASLVTSMGRMAAHTGRIITYDQILNGNHEFAPGLDKLSLDSPAPLPQGPMDDIRFRSRASSPAANMPDAATRQRREPGMGANTTAKARQALAKPCSCASIRLPEHGLDCLERRTGSHIRRRARPHEHARDGLRAAPTMFRLRALRSSIPIPADAGVDESFVLVGEGLDR